MFLAMTPNQIKSWTEEILFVLYVISFFAAFQAEFYFFSALLGLLGINAFIACLVFAWKGRKEK